MQLAQALPTLQAPIINTTGHARAPTVAPENISSTSTIARYSQVQRAAALRLYHLAKRQAGTYAGMAAAHLLLGLYDGERFPLDLAALRALAGADYTAAQTAIDMHARCNHVGVHELLSAILGGERVGAELEHWAYGLGLPGRSKRADLPPLGTVGLM